MTILAIIGYLIGRYHCTQAFQEDLGVEASLLKVSSILVGLNGNSCIKSPIILMNRLQMAGAAYNYM